MNHLDTSNKRIWQITYPVLMTLLAQNVVNITDTAFLGHYGDGKIELGASAMAGVFYIAIFMVGFGFSQGSQILIGRRNGEKQYEAIGKIFNNGILFNLLMAIVIFLLSKLLISPILSTIIRSENIYHASIEYLNWRIYGFFFAFINVMFRAFYVGVTRTKVLSVSAIITASVNVLFDYILIFGNWGMPEMGIKGAAIASVLAEAVTTVYIILYTLKRTNIKLYGLFSFSKIEFNVIKRTLDVSIYIMFQYFISVSTWFLFFLFIERTGEEPLAISNIVRTLYATLIIPANAFGTVTSTIVSNLIGETRSDEVLHFIKKMLKINTLVFMPIIILTFAFPELLIKIYTPDVDLMYATVPVLRVVSIALLVIGTGIILFNSVSATGNTRIAFIFEFTVLFFYVFYTCLTTVIFPLPVSYVWGAEYVYWGLIAIMSFFYLKYGNWQKIKI